MKKFISILFFTSVLMTGCSLDKHPSGSIDSTSAIESVADAHNMRNYLYLYMRSLYSGSGINSAELSSDCFHATADFGNRGGDWYLWNWYASNSTIKTIWANTYAMIAQANFILEGIDAMDKTDLSTADLEQLELYKGECYFCRALGHFLLAERFCEVYDPSNAGNQMGVPLMDKYLSTSNSALYPGRSSLKATYEHIYTDLKYASDRIKVAAKADSGYLTADAVAAMKARVALVRGDWDTAIENATSLVNGGTYPLLSDADKFAEMWVKDNGKESILQLDASFPKSLPNANGSYYIGFSMQQNTYSPDFIPEQWIVDLYDHQNDIRFEAFFAQRELTFTATSGGDAYICVKFPGNPELYEGQTNYVNKVKMFRIAEQYLIAAEAYARKGNNDGAASAILNQLKSKRISGWQEVSYSGSQLLEEIRRERVRELFAEGFRTWDLKRWNLPMKRSAAQNPAFLSLPGASTTEFLNIAAGDYRFTWPIPQAEMDANPQLAGQQNKNY